MNKREKMLAAAVACLIIALGGRYMYSSYEDALAKRESDLATAREQLAEVKVSLNRGERAVRQLEQWRERSLPTDRAKALPLYKEWLMAKAKEAGLNVADIQPAPVVGRMSENLSAIAYQMKATGSLSSVVGLMYEFYRSRNLHQITLLRLIQSPGSPTLQVTFQAEAILLPGATATDALPEGESGRPKLKSLAEYQKSLGERDLVSVYKAPRPPVTTQVRERPAPPKFDDAEQAYFSGFTGIGNGMQAWINVRTTGETLRLSAGDPLKVGAIEGKIVSIEPRAIVWQSGDKKYRVPLGESLRKGKELDADTKDASRDDAERSES